MQLLKRYKKWIIGAGVLIVAFVLYGIFFTDTTSDRTGLVSTTTNNGAQVTGTVQAGQGVISGQIISALNQIESLRLDRSIFDDPVYRSLRDRSRELSEESVGKANPFDPINSSNLQFNEQEDPAGTNNDIQEGASGRLIPGNQTGPRGPQTIINTAAPAI